MSEVGVVSIVLGAVVVCSRGPLLVAPAMALRWFESVIGTNGRIRALGAVAVPLGAAMVWAGESGYGGLATVLSLFGWAFIGISVPLLLLFPSVYRAIGEAMLPIDADADLSGWRVLGLVGVMVGASLIYFGALAL